MNRLAVRRAGADNRTQAVLANIVSCSRTRASRIPRRLQGLPLCDAVDDFPAYFAASSCPHGWIPAFAGMTRVGLERRFMHGSTRRRPLPGKLSLDGGLVDDRPDRDNLGELELIKDVLRKRDYAPVDVQPEELPLWGALEGEAGSDERGRAGQKLDIEAEIGDVLEILYEHVTVAGQLERSAVMLNLIIDVLSEFLPIPSIQAVDVGAVEIGKRRRGQNGILLGCSGLPHRDRPSSICHPRKSGDPAVGHDEADDMSREARKRRKASLVASWYSGCALASMTHARKARPVFDCVDSLRSQ